MDKQWNHELILKARMFATAAHAAVGQKRKYTGEDYIVHPAEVAQMVFMTQGATEEMVAAAWLHDVVEDTKVTLALIRQEFGDIVAEYVGWLTDISKPEDGNRATRKAIDRQHASWAPPEAKTIKLADLISNTGTITKYDPAFARVYLAEKKLLLEVLEAGDPFLFKMAHQLAYK